MGEDAVLQLTLLGAFAVVAKGAAVEPRAWRVKKAAGLVKILALAPDHRVRREELMEWLWPDLDRYAGANNLRFALFSARQALGEKALRSDGAALRLSEGARVDVDEFERAANTSRRASTKARCDEAIALYRGDLLPDDLYEDWSVARREQLRATNRALLRQCASIAEKAGDVASERDALERVVAADPTDEAARVRLMRLHVRAGDRAEAIRQYELLVAALRAELDTAPDPTTSAAYRDISSGANASLTRRAESRDVIAGGSSGGT